MEKEYFCKTKNISSLKTEGPRRDRKAARQGFKWPAAALLPTQEEREKASAGQKAGKAM